ncbi:MAG TPA: DUF5672 family protein, partial [Casimicrobiaceae bacterium]|nr:DUF5672 family protein [Casimicrobiaceae bacterium]
AVLDLPTVTLLVVDTAEQGLALRALEESSKEIRFARRVLIGAHRVRSSNVPGDIDVSVVDAVASPTSRARFMLSGLLDHVTTPHVLVVHWDAYVINPAAWDARFLQFDYVGARRHARSESVGPGSGGFSLRSRKLLGALSSADMNTGEADNVVIARTLRARLEREHGVRFADDATADRFAFASGHPIGKPFGFEGLENFGRVMSPEQLAALAPDLSESIARSTELVQLTRNCVGMGLWSAATALAQRRLAVVPNDREIRVLLAQAQSAVARGPVVGRNDPCPCGSGKRYKICHGAIEGQFGSALGSSRPSASRMPVAQRLQIALAAHQRGDLDAAEEQYRAVLATEPANAMAMHYLGVIEYQRERPEQALPLIEGAIARVPNEPEFHNNLGLVLTALDRYDDAIAAFNQTLTLQPRHAAAWSNLGLASMAQRDVDTAILAYRRAIGIAPDYAQAHWNLALALLAKGHYAEGWREYEWRLSIPEFRRHGAPLTTPRWHGESVTGKTVLITREQGLGDTLQFIRFVPDLVARGARIIVEAPPPLVHLVATAPGVSTVVREGDVFPDHDMHVPLLSLPHLLGVTVDRIEARIPYMLADWKRRSLVREQIEEHSRSRLRVGLSWNGASGNTLNRRRSCPLIALAPLLEMPSVTWYSLQKGDAELEMARVPAARDMVLLDARNDFDGTAAMVAELDLVVSVDTSIGHLGAVLGKPVWLMLAFAADWRWGSSDSTRWYPLVRLFRQPRAGDWSGVVAQLAAALQARAAR